MNGTIIGITKQLAKAAGFQLANGCNLADRDVGSDQKSLMMQKSLAICDDIEVAINFIYDQQEEIDNLTEANHRLKAAINEQNAKIEELKAKVREYYTAEQEIPGR